MQLDDLALVLAEVAGLEEHGVGNADLADVVQDAGRPQPLQFVIVPAHVAGDLDGIRRHPLGMTLRVRVAGFDSVR